MDPSKRGQFDPVVTSEVDLTLVNGKPLDQNRVTEAPEASATQNPGAMQNVAQRVFCEYPDLHIPKVKWRGFNPNNIKVADIPVVKFFLCGIQIVKRWTDDKYSGLRSVVVKYNSEKSLDNINGVIKQLQLLKANESTDFNDETLTKLAGEVAIYKFQMLAQSPDDIKFIPAAARDITLIDGISPELRQCINDYNQDKTKENFLKLHNALFKWIETGEAQKKYAGQIQQILYELSTGVEDVQLYELFNLLNTDKTHIAHQKLEELRGCAAVDDGRAIRFCQGNVLNIPQINVRLSRSKELLALKRAINTFNREKTPENFMFVIAALQDWQYKNSEGFNNSNGLKIIQQMMEILKGVSKQDKIKKLDSYIFLASNKEKLEHSKDPKWNVASWDFGSWKTLPTPDQKKTIKTEKEGEVLLSTSTELTQLHAAICEFNNAKKQEDLSSLTMMGKLLNINKLLFDWIEKHPDEFNTCGGEDILKALQKNILSSVVKTGFSEIHAELSPELQDVNSRIKHYNSQPSIDALIALEGALKVWQKAHPDVADGKEITSGEFSRYHGREMLHEIQKILQERQNPTGDLTRKQKPFPTILLPSTHPSSVFDKSMTLGQPEANGKSGYLMIFHNPIAPWSHSEIGIATGPSSVKPDSFILASEKQGNPRLFDDYIKGGVLVKEISEFSFPSNRQYVHDVINYILIPHGHIRRKKEDFINTDLDKDFDQDFASMVYTYFTSNGFIGPDGRVTAKYFNPPQGHTPADWDFHDDPEINAKMKKYIQSVMPKPLNPEEFGKQIEKMKSQRTFKFLKDKNYINEKGYLDQKYLHKGSQLWKDISALYSDDKDYADYLITVLANQISRSFTETSFMRELRTPEESSQLFTFLKNNNLLQSHTNSRGEEQLFLKKDWESLVMSNETVRSEFEKLPHREAFVQQLGIFGTFGETTKREYLGIGAEQEGLDLVSKDAEGVRLTDTRLVSRLEKLCKRRKNEIQKNMNVFAGAQGGARAALKGGYATLLHTEEDRVRHFRQALIDNFLTSVDPQAFLPNLKEPRYRLEVYESGGEIYHKWIEDPNGKFGKVRNVSQASQDHSGEYIEGEYHKNSYVLGADGRLKSAKSLDKEKLETHERGNIVYKADGTREWMADDKFGQCFKPKGTDKKDLSDVEQDDRPMYSAMNCEKYLANGESEWCGSYAMRMLHSAYAFEYMPEFQSLLQSLAQDFRMSTSFDKDDPEHSQFEKRHALSLFILAEQYAKRIVASEAGRKYFRDMHPAVRVNPRSTPDQIHEFLLGKDPGLLNSAARAAKTMQMPTMRDEEGQMKSVSLSVCTGIGHGFTAVLGSPTAVFKLVFNVTTATVHTFTTDIVKAAHQSYQRKAEELDRKKDAGKTVKYAPGRLFKAATFDGLLVGGLGRRVGMQYLGGQEIVDRAKKVKTWAVSRFRNCPLPASAFA